MRARAVYQRAALALVFPPERVARALRRLFGRRDGDGPYPRDGS